MGDQWADARTPLTEAQLLAGPPNAEQITAEELARLIARQGGYRHGAGRENWEDLESHEQALRVRAAERLLVEIGARDLSDRQRALIARIRSAGDSAVSDVEDAASAIANAVDEALDHIDSGTTSGKAEARREGILYVLDELERLEITDEIAGDETVDVAARRIRRECS